MTLSPDHQLHQAFVCMEAHGGGFSRLIAAAWFHADSENKTKIETTWPEMIEKYLKFSLEIGNA